MKINNKIEISSLYCAIGEEVGLVGCKLDRHFSFVVGCLPVHGARKHIELNPVRAGMVEHPAKYRWSSYRANAQGETDSLIRPHPIYEAMGLDLESRQAAYQELFRHELDLGVVDQIRRATNGNFALGEGRFSAGIAAALGRRVTPGKSGRPRKVVESESGELFA